MKKVLFASFRLRRQNKALTSFPSFVGELKKQQKLDDFRPFSIFLQQLPKTLKIIYDVF